MVSLSAAHPPVVTLGLEPRALHLGIAPLVQSPRVRPEDDDRGSGTIPPHPQCHPGPDPGPIPKSTPTARWSERTTSTNAPSQDGSRVRPGMTQCVWLIHRTSPSPSQGEARWGSSPPAQNKSLPLLPPPSPCAILHPLPSLTSGSREPACEGADGAGMSRSP